MPVKRYEVTYRYPFDKATDSRLCILFAPNADAAWKACQSLNGNDALVVNVDPAC